MTIHQRMKAIFAAADVPGFLQAWRNTSEYPVIPDKYCTYLVTAERAELCCDDDIAILDIGVCIHLWGRTDVTEEYNRLISAIAEQDHLTLIPRSLDLDDVRQGEYHYHRRIDTQFFEFL